MRSAILLGAILAAIGCGAGSPTSQPKPPVEPPKVEKEIYDKVAPMPREKGAPAPE